MTNRIRYGWVMVQSLTLGWSIRPLQDLLKRAHSVSSCWPAARRKAPEEAR